MHQGDYREAAGRAPIGVAAPVYRRGCEGDKLPFVCGCAVTESILVSEWDAETFHKRVLELEAQGYVSRRESYRITAEMNPETGIVSHVHTIELYRPPTTSQVSKG